MIARRSSSSAPASWAWRSPTTWRALGVTDVVVVDQSYLCGGASGRNGGGVRAQWSSEANIRLMQESIRMCRDFAVEMKINVWFRQGGYLFLARTRGQAARAREERDAPERVRPRHADAHAERGARASSPSSTPTASSPRATTRTTASSSRGRSCGATRRRRGSSASRCATFTEVVGLRDARARASTAVVRRRTSRPGRPRTTTRVIETHRVVNAARRVVARDRADARRRAPEQAAPPRDLLDRAAQAVAQAARRRPLATASTSASRRAARSSAASARSACPTGSNQESSSRVPRPLRARARRARAPCSAT